jgi:hypothetical protein
MANAHWQFQIARLSLEDRRPAFSESVQSGMGHALAKVHLYVGKTAVKFNIPEVEAVERLKDLIREHGKWVDAAPQGSALETVS